MGGELSGRAGRQVLGEVACQLVGEDRTEDRDTVEYACWCAGKFERNRVYDDGHRESIDYRALIDGWNPLEPVDLNEGIAGGWRVFFKAARALLDPERFAVGQAQTARAYSADTQYSDELGSMQGSELAQIQSIQAAVWRAEDLERYKMWLPDRHTRNKVFRNEMI